MPQNSEATANFCYCDSESDLFFSWDGLGPEVEVSRGGYGEPVIDRFPLRFRHQPRSAARWLEYFSISCVLYIKEKQNGDNRE